MKREMSLAFLSMLLLAGVAFAEVGSVEGIVIDSDGNPLEAISVGLMMVDVCDLKAFTSADGSYQFTDVEEGIYTLVAGLKNMGNFTVENVEVIAGETTMVPEITLVPDALHYGPQHKGDGLIAVLPTLEKAFPVNEEMSMGAVKALFR